MQTLLAMDKISPSIDHQKWIDEWQFQIDNEFSLCIIRFVIQSITKRALAQVQVALEHVGTPENGTQRPQLLTNCVQIARGGTTPNGVAVASVHCICWSFTDIPYFLYYKPPPLI